MKRKRVISVLLIVMLVLSCTGCKKELPIDPDAVTEVDNVQTGTEENITQEDTTSAETVTKMVPEEGANLVYWTSSNELEYAKIVAQNFEAEYGVPVTVEENGLGNNDKVALGGPAGTAADVFMCTHDTFQSGLNSGIYLEFDDAIANELKKTVNEVGIKTVTSNGKIYGVPYALETTCLFYNKDLVGDTPATTFEEIIEKAKTFNDPDNNLFYFLYKIGDGYKSYPMLSAYGFSLFGADGTDEDNPGFDSDEFEKGLELISSLKEIMPMSATDLSNEGSLRTQFVEGKLAYFISGPWDITTIKETGVNFGVSVFPTYNGRALTPFAGVTNAHVSAYTKYPVAAQLFAQYLVNDDSANLLYSVANKIPTLMDVSKVTGLSEDEYAKPFVEQFGNSVPMPSVSRISYYWNISAALVQSVFEQQLTPAEGRAKAISDWNNQLASE